MVWFRERKAGQISGKAQEEKWVGMIPMCVSRVEDEWEMMGMTMGMNTDGIRWAQDEHERGMNVMQPCMVMQGWYIMGLVQ